MRASLTPLVALAALAFAACGARVSVGFVDVPDGGDLPAETGPPEPQPPPFAIDAARRETSAPSPGCAEKQCADFCTPCKDDGAMCPPASVFHVCSGFGDCLPEQPRCVVIQELDAEAPSQAYVPCAGRACGAACTSCTSCSSPIAGFCQVDGMCAALPADCR